MAAVKSTKYKRDGKTSFPEHAIWKSMKQRCQPHNKAHAEYFDRGIVVCDEWVESFWNFYKDMGPRPAGRYSIDRIDNDLGYFPGNCRWATPSEQALNTRRNVLMTYNGRTLTQNEWAKELGVSRLMLHHRLRRGWSAEEALRTPPVKGIKNAARIVECVRKHSLAMPHQVAKEIGESNVNYVIKTMIKLKKRGILTSPSRGLYGVPQ